MRLFVYLFAAYGAAMWVINMAHWVGVRDVLGMPLK